MDKKFQILSKRLYYNNNISKEKYKNILLNYNICKIKLNIIFFTYNKVATPVRKIEHKQSI
jgi:hypothetical protein